jgi:RNA polymerase sigma-70 factor (ECF subfamily)
VRSAATARASADRRPLDAGRDGDVEVFQRLFEGQRAAIQAHCYRMLGSLHDAEDALQETLLRAWRAYVCIDAIRRRPKRVLPIDYGPATEPQVPVHDPIWIEPYPDQELGIEDGAAAPDARYEQREAIELAFVAALQQLPAKQRAVLILRDVLGFSAKEVAVILETTVASINSALHRARSASDRRLPDRSQQATVRSLGDARVRNLVERFVNAFEAGDVAAILALLAEDATFAMPPYPGWCRGREAIADSWLMPGGPPPRMRYLPTRANGQLALGVYLRDPRAGGYFPICLDVLAMEHDRISEVIAFRSPRSFARFDLPEELPLDGPSA